MSLRSTETELIGSWKIIDGRTVEDETSKRIRALTSKELTFVAVSKDGWERLYQDPRDHRFWELTYPSSEMHSGGPPVLRIIEEEAARRKYKVEQR